MRSWKNWILAAGAIILMTLWIWNRKAISELRIQWPVAIVILAVVFFEPISERIRSIKSLSWPEGAQFHIADKSDFEHTNEALKDLHPVSARFATEWKSEIDVSNAETMPQQPKSTSRIGIVSKSRLAFQALPEPDLIDGLSQQSLDKGIHRFASSVASVLSIFEYTKEGPIAKLTPEAADYLTALTGVVGWTELAVQWQKLMTQYISLLQLTPDSATGRQKAARLKLRQVWLNSEHLFQQKLRAVLESVEQSD